MIKLSDYRTENALPTEMQTIQRKSMAYAFDRQKKKFIERTNQVYIWADLDNVNDQYLDPLAIELRTQYYDIHLPAETKRALIKNTIQWYLYAGTRSAVEELISTILGIGKIEEWHEYNSFPYHFRIVTDAQITPDTYAVFQQMIRKVKNARSRLDTIKVIRDVTEKEFSGMGVTSIVKAVPIYSDWEV